MLIISQLISSSDLIIFNTTIQCFQLYLKPKIQRNLKQISKAEKEKLNRAKKLARVIRAIRAGIRQNRKFKASRTDPQPYHYIDLIYAIKSIQIYTDQSSTGQ